MCVCVCACVCVCVPTTLYSLFCSVWVYVCLPPSSPLPLPLPLPLCPSLPLPLSSLAHSHLYATVTFSAGHSGTALQVMHSLIDVIGRDPNLPVCTSSTTCVTVQLAGVLASGSSSASVERHTAQGCFDLQDIGSSCRFQQICPEGHHSTLRAKARENGSLLTSLDGERSGATFLCQHGV